MQDFEKLGLFYLGRSYDLKAKQPKDDLVLYDSKDLVTHAVCVGMTGSGKTGLCLSLLEEAAIDSIPAVVIDPKGDLSNLLLTFPQLRGEDFAPWINQEEARRQGISPQDYANQQAERWKKGLAEWGQDGSRIQRLRDAADFTIYTPGSTAGLPVSILKSFAAPESAILNDNELLRERINTTATSLLALLGLEGDPIQSREHILLSTILNSAWKERRDLDLATLIQQIQSPPVAKIGIMDLETFFPAKDRFGLAMHLNNLLAAPGFEAWMEGEALDINAILHTPAGKPRLSIFSIAHLNDAERMFFVSLLLNQTLGWMRTQPGTTSLRALVYMDEIFGYFPPVANPPSKAPLLTMLKQARAFGVGVVLATQNPVDLDYKGLSNAGTWFIGRLQTERDKARVLDGLEGAAAGSGGKFDRRQMEQTLAGLGNRIFLMHNVHEDAPEVFQVRWAMSYLRGPLTRDQIRVLTDARRHAGQPAPASSSGGPPPLAKFAPPSGTALSSAASQRPVLPPGVPEYFGPVRTTPPNGGELLYRPMLLGCGQIYFTDTKAGVDTEQAVCFLTAITQEAVAVHWQEAAPVTLTDADLDRAPTQRATFAALPPEASKPKNYDAWKKSFADWLYRSQRLELFKSPGLKEFAQPGESERDFRVRLQQAAREERDQRVEKLRQKYAPRLAALEERIRRAMQAVEREASQAEQSKWQAAVSFGATVLGAVMGRKKVSATTVGKATTAARGVGRSMKESQDVSRAKETVEALSAQRDRLEAQFHEECLALETKIDPLTEELQSLSLKPKKTNISVKLVALVWAPFWKRAGGTAVPAWE